MSYVKKAVRFSRLRYWMYGLSIAVIAASWAFTFVRGGFNLGIDFKPGLSEIVQITAGTPSVESVRAALKNSDHNFTVQPVGAPQDHKFQLRGVATADEAKVTNLQEVIAGKVMAALEAAFGAGSIQVLQSEFIGPSLSDELVWQTVWIALAAILVILLYIWFRFKFAYALAAIVGLIHDPLMVLGLIGATQMEVTTATIAVLLTIIGYSMNDKIVVFDRIRENLRLKENMNLYDLVDLSITETLSRTIVSSLTVVLSMLAVYIFTQGSIQDFALALIVGVVIATYSSIFTSATLMVAFAGGKPPIEKEKPKSEGEIIEA